MDETFNSEGNEPSNSKQPKTRSCKRPLSYADIARGKRSNKVRIIETSIENTKVADKILGATICDGTIIFMLKWKGVDDGTMITLDEAREMYPQELIKFYEENYSFVKCKN